MIYFLKLVINSFAYFTITISFKNSSWHVFHGNDFDQLVQIHSVTRGSTVCWYQRNLVTGSYDQSANIAARSEFSGHTCWRLVACRMTNTDNSCFWFQSTTNKLRNVNRMAWELPPILQLHWSNTNCNVARICHVLIPIYIYIFMSRTITACWVEINHIYFVPCMLFSQLSAWYYMLSFPPF